jgi:hypothetical protein
MSPFHKGRFFVLDVLEAGMFDTIHATVEHSLSAGLIG